MTMISCTTDLSCSPRTQGKVLMTPRVFLDLNADQPARNISIRLTMVMIMKPTKSLARRRRASSQRARLNKTKMSIISSKGRSIWEAIIQDCQLPATIIILKGPSRAAVARTNLNQPPDRIVSLSTRVIEVSQMAQMPIILSKSTFNSCNRTLTCPQSRILLSTKNPLSRILSARETVGVVKKIRWAQTKTYSLECPGAWVLRTRSMSGTNTRSREMLSLTHS